MKNEEIILEQYTFYRLADIDLEQTARTLCMIRRYRKNDVINALIRDAVVSYSRPFSRCDGKLRKHQLNLKNVPRSYRKLHKKILDYRNEIFAHTDIKARKPKVVRWKINSNYFYPMSFRGFSPKDFVRDLSRFEDTIHKVRDNISNKMREIERKYFQPIAGGDR